MFNQKASEPIEKFELHRAVFYNNKEKVTHLLKSGFFFNLIL